MTVYREWSKNLLRVMRKLNNFNCSSGSSKGKVTSLFVAGHEVGILNAKVVDALRHYPDAFEICTDSKVCERQFVKLCDKFETYEERSVAVEKVLIDMAKRDAHISLRGWRNEYYEVASSPTEPPLLKVERAATSMFGVKTYGSHMNGYVNHPDKGLCLWIARRSMSKATFPGMLDNMVAGGISIGVGIFETLIKECEEEAGIPESLARTAVSVGMLSYVYEDERGIQRDVQYCFDLEVPHDFVPTALDGEVEDFKLCSIDEVKDMIIGDNFKPNCAAVTLHFLIRRGFVLPDEVPDYIEIIQLLHCQF